MFPWPEYRKMDTMQPSPNGDNGRDGHGRFAKGNPGGPGNPFARRTAALRSVMLDTVGEDDLKAIVAKLVEQAKGGDVVAAREVLTRIIGRPTESPDPDRLDAHEATLLLHFNRLRQEAEALCGELDLDYEEVYHDDPHETAAALDRRCRRREYFAQERARLRNEVKRLAKLK